MKKFITLSCFFAFLFLQINTPGAFAVGNYVKSESSIKSKSAFTITVSSTNETCFGLCDGSITIDVQGGVPTFPVNITLILPPELGGSSIDYGDFASLPQTITNLCGASTNYTVQVTDTDLSQVFDVGYVNSPMDISLSISKTDACFGVCNGYSDVIPSGGNSPFTYSWSTGGTNSYISDVCPAIYEVTVTDFNGCTKAQTVTLNESPELSLSVGGANISCNGLNDGYAEAFTTGGIPSYNYSWSNSVFTQNNNGLAPGWYYVTVSDYGGCQKIDSIEIIEPDVLSYAIIGTDPTCYGGSNGSIDFTPIGGMAPYTYSWSNGYTGEDPSGLVANLYSVTLTDNNGCETWAGADLFNPAQIYISADTIPSTCGISDGSISVIPSSGVPPYIYNWSNGGTSSGISGVMAGTYTVTVSDNIGCTNKKTINLNDVGAPNLSISGLVNPSCKGNCDGLLAVTGTGGVSPYSYSWTSGGTASSETGLCDGEHTVLVTANDGCKSSLTMELSEPQQLSVQVNGYDPLCAGNADGWAEAVVSGGTSPMNYLWDDLSITVTSNALSLSAGMYHVTVTDFNGCVEYGSVELVDPMPLSAVLTKTDLTCFDSYNGSVSVSVSGGTPAYMYYWSNDNQSDYLDGISAGTYTVTVTDENGCQLIDSAEIFSPDTLAVSFIVNDPVCAGNSDGSIDMTVTGGVAPYTFNWNNGETTEDISGLKAQMYTVDIFDANGCYLFKQVELFNPMQMVFNTGGVNSSCGLNDGAVWVTQANGGVPPFTYSWSPAGTTDTLYNVGSDHYVVTVTDNIGCTYTDYININDMGGPVVTMNASSSPLCHSSTDGSLDIFVTGGTSPYGYSWSSGQVTEDISGVGKGSYTVVVTDASGCEAFFTHDLFSPDSLVWDFSMYSPVCAGEANGSISLDQTYGGTPSYFYLWNTTETTNSISSLAAGTYTVTVTDANGCANQETFVLSDPPALVIDSVSITDASCNGNVDGIIEIFASGGMSPYQYSVDAGSTWVWGNMIYSLPAGSYDVMIKDVNYCYSGIYTHVVSEPAILTVSTSVVDVSCNGGSDGEVSAIPSGGTMPYSYNWNNMYFSQTVTSLNADFYNLTVSDANGCQVFDNAILNEPSAVNPSIDFYTNPSCQGGANGSISLITFGGTGSYVYSWSSGGTTNTETGLMAGTYTVTATDLNGCMGMATQTLIDPAPIVGSLDSFTDATCFAGSDGTASVSASGGTGTFTYLWPSTNTSSTETGLAAGAYIATITDGNGCQTTISASINEPSPINIVEVITNENCGIADGDINITVSGGTAPYSFNWSNTQTTEDISGLTAGTYEVTVTDFNGCVQASGIYSVSSASSLIADAGVDITICSGVAYSLGGAPTAMGGTAPYTYMWDNAVFLDNSSISNPTTSAPTTTTYSLTVTDNTGCIAVDVITITVGSIPIADAGVDATVCEGSGVSLGGAPTASGGTSPYFYSWDNAASLSSSTDANPVATLTATTSFVVTVTDINACSSTDTVVVSVDSAPTADAGLDQTICANNASVTLNGNFTNASGMIWSGGTGSFSPGPTDPNAIYIPSAAEILAGSVTLTNTTTGNGSCTAATASMLLSISPAPIVSAGSDFSVCPEMGYINLSSSYSGAGGVIWSTTGAGSFNNDILPNVVYTPDISELNGTVITFIATTTSNGTCIPEVDSVVVNINPPVEATTVATGDQCGGGANGSITITPTGGTGPFLYLWDDPGLQTSSVASGLAAGIYHATITDFNGCTTLITDTVTDAVPISIVEQLANATCSGGSDGAIAITVSGGTLPYSFSWTGPSGFTSVTEDISGLLAGIYNVTVTDASLCNANAQYEILQPTALDAQINLFSNVTCNGAADGQAEVSVTGGAMPYTYAWSNGGSSNAVSNLAPGTYTVTVVDNNLCTVTPSILINQPPALVVNTIAQNNISCFGAADGLLEVSASGGTGAMSYLWSEGSVTPVISGLGAGSYTITVTDDNGCTGTLVLSVSEPSQIVATVNSVTNVNCFGGADGSAVVSVNGGVSPYMYLWSNGNTASVGTGLAADIYTITVTDNSFCTTLAYASIAEPAQLSVLASPNHVSCYGENSGSITAVVSGGNAPYTYQWPSGGSQMLEANLTAGTYMVTVTDSHGCTQTASSTLIQPAEFVVGVTSSDATCNNSSDGSIVISATGGTTGYSYNWSNGAYTSSQYGLSAGSYIITVSDGNGCSQINTVTLGQPAPFSVASTIGNAGCDDIADGNVDITVSGGTVPYSFNWSDGSTSEDLALVLPGIYQVTITDDNGCTHTKQFNVGVSYSGSIFGFVTEESVPLTQNAVRVELYSESQATGAPFLLIGGVLIDAAGSYSFGQLQPDSTYFVKAVILDQNQYPQVITTYYNDAYSFGTATPVEVGCQTPVNIDIEMYTIPEPAAAGGAYISGTVTYNNVPGSKTIGDPVPGAEIYIEVEPNDEPVANTTTDSTGFYEFEHIASGHTYSIVVDIPGLPQFSTHSFTVGDDDTLNTNLDFHVDTTGTEGGIYRVNASSVEELDVAEFVAMVFPNPFADYVTISYMLNDISMVDIQVIDMQGRVVSTLYSGEQAPGAFEYRFDASQSGNVAGIYYLKISVNEHMYVKKLVNVK